MTVLAMPAAARNGDTLPSIARVGDRGALPQPR